MYGPPRFVLQAMDAELVASPASVRSPRPPGLIAKIGCTPRYPLVTMTVPGPAIGVGTVTSELPVRRHSSLPVAGS